MSYASIIDIFNERVEQSANHVALRFYRGDRTVSWTWHDWNVEVVRVIHRLKTVGVRRGHRVVILSRNRPEWVVLDLAIMALGAVSVPIHPATLARHCRWTLRHAAADWIVVEDPFQLEKLLDVPAELESLVGCLVIDRHCKLERPDRKGRVEIEMQDLTLPNSLATKIRWYDDVQTDVAELPAAIDAELDGDDVASIVYTSGTTGTPRGAVLTHRNFVGQVLGNAEIMPIHETDRQILLLPLSQIFARILYMTAIHLGAETSFSSGFSHLLTEFQREKPTFFVGVPSVFERLGSRFAIDSSTHPLLGNRRLRRLARSAIYKSRELQGRGSMGVLDRMVFEVGNRTIFREFRNLFGGRLRFAISGGAPLSVSVCEIFHAVGIPIYEGYGLTEACGAAAANSPANFVSGTVGEALPGVTIRLAENDEVLLQGDTIARGYWNDEASTEQNFVDGWFRTGDIGELVDHQANPLDARESGAGIYLKIHERIDDAIVLKGGKMVSPQHVESVLQSVPVIRNAVVATINGSTLLALLTLDSQLLRSWARQHGRLQESFEALCVDPSVYEWVKREIESVNRVLKPSEAVHDFAILPTTFSPETGEMTHTFKIRRRFVIDKYRSVLERLESRNA